MHAWGVSIWVSSLVVGSTVKRWLSHVYGQFFQVFVYLWPIVWFLFPHLTCLKILPNMHVAWIQPRDLWGRPWHHLFLGGTPSFFTPKESFCACAVSPLPQRWEIWHLDLLCSVSVITVILLCPQEAKAGYLPYFYCYFYWNANKRWIVNI